MTDQQADLLSGLYAAIYTAGCSSEAQSARIQAQRTVDDLCSQHRFLARERARMVKEIQKTRVVVAQRARRGEPLFPVKVIKANGRVRKFGHQLPSGRAPRLACNTRTRGSRRTRTTSSSSDDPGGSEPPDELAPALLGRAG